MPPFFHNDQVPHFILSLDLLHTDFLYITSHLVEINFLLGCSNASSWDIIILKKGNDVSLLIFIGIVSANVSFFEFISYYTLVPSNDNICHFPSNVNLPSSPPDDSTITHDVSPAPL